MRISNIFLPKTYPKIESTSGRVILLQ